MAQVDFNQLSFRRNEVAMQLLAHIEKTIEREAPHGVISELTLAYRYLEGGAQPGNGVVKK